MLSVPLSTLLVSYEMKMVRVVKGTLELSKLNSLSIIQKVEASCLFQNVELYGEEWAGKKLHGHF